MARQVLRQSLATSHDLHGSGLLKHSGWQQAVWGDELGFGTNLLLVPVDSLQVLHKVRRGQGVEQRAGLVAAVQLRRPRCSALALGLTPSPGGQACSTVEPLQLWGF